MGNFRLTRVRQLQNGFTLMELLIVVAVIIVLFFILLTAWRSQILKSHDARRKADLGNIQRVFEEYHNDNGCYPSPSILDDCGGTGLQPYMDRIPCDPSTNDPYLYVPTSDICSGYRILTQLRDTADPDIIEIGCNPSSCGYAYGYNWGLSAGVPIVDPNFDPVLTPTPTTPPAHQYNGYYACSPGASCNNYGSEANLLANGCPISFPNNSCNESCHIPANRCAY